MRSIKKSIQPGDCFAPGLREEGVTILTPTLQFLNQAIYLFATTLELSRPVNIKAMSYEFADRRRVLVTFIGSRNRNLRESCLTQEAFLFATNVNVATV